MPEITGYYYILSLADADDKFQEQDEMNNLFYTTLDPIYFEYGISYLSKKNSNQKFEFKNPVEISPKNIKRSEFNTSVTTANKNAYTPEEILEFFKKEKESGAINKKVNQYLERAKKHEDPKMN
jgi:hypothetical protein